MTDKLRPSSTFGLGLISIELFSDLAILARDPAENFEDILRSLRGETTELSRYIVPLSSSAELRAAQLPAATEDQLNTEFDAWYKFYPRKVGKWTARLAYKRARQTASAETLLEAVTKFSSAVDLSRIQYCPHPATWLNGHRWDDEDMPQSAADLKSSMPFFPI